MRWKLGSFLTIYLSFLITDYRIPTLLLDDSSFFCTTLATAPLSARNGILNHSPHLHISKPNSSWLGILHIGDVVEIKEFGLFTLLKIEEPKDLRDRHRLQFVKLKNPGEKGELILMREVDDPHMTKVSSADYIPSHPSFGVPIGFQEPRTKRKAFFRILKKIIASFDPLRENTRLSSGPGLVYRYSRNGYYFLAYVHERFPTALSLLIYRAPQDMVKDSWQLLEAIHWLWQPPSTNLEEESKPPVVLQYVRRPTGRTGRVLKKLSKLKAYQDLKPWTKRAPSIFLIPGQAGNDQGHLLPSLFSSDLFKEVRDTDRSVITIQGIANVWDAYTPWIHGNLETSLRTARLLFHQLRHHAGWQTHLSRNLLEDFVILLERQKANRGRSLSDLLKNPGHDVEIQAIVDKMAHHIAELRKPKHLLWNRLQILHAAVNGHLILDSEQPSAAAIPVLLLEKYWKQSRPHRNPQNLRKAIAQLIEEGILRLPTRWVQENGDLHRLVKVEVQMGNHLFQKLAAGVRFLDTDMIYGIRLTPKTPLDAVAA